MNLGRKIQNEHKDAFETFTPIFMLQKMLCLNIIGRENKHLKITCSRFKRIFTIVSIIIITIMVTAHKMKELCGEYFKFKSLLRLTYLYGVVVYTIDLSYVFKFGGLITLKYFEIYGQIDKVIGITYFSIIKAKVLKFTVLFSLFWAIIIFTGITSGFYNTTIISNYKSTFELLFFSLECILSLKSTLTTIEICANIMQIEFRLKAIKDKLHNLNYFTHIRIDAFAAQIENNRLNSPKTKGTARNKIGPLTNLLTNHCHDIVWLQKCYLLLIEQNIFINQVFGVRVSQFFFVISVIFESYLKVNGLMF